jgi:hypothetical protein
MPKLSVAEFSTPTAPARVYPDDLEPAIQQALAALADVETRYERLHDRLSGWSGSQAIRERLVQQLEAWHQKAQEAHVLRLGELQQRMKSSGLFPRQSVH